MARTTSSSTSKTTTLTASAAVTAFAANPAMVPVAISDTTANVGKYLDGLQGLAAAGKITAIRLSDTRTMTITGSQFFADAGVILYLPDRQLLIVTGATAADADTIQAFSRVKSFRITDGSANVSARLDALNNDTKLTQVTLTDAGPIGMTHAQLTKATSILGKLPSTVTYAVSAVPASAAASVQANAKVASFAVADTAATVLANLGTIGGLAKLTSVVLTDTDVLRVTQAQYQAHGTVLSRLAAEETLAVTAVSATDAAAIAADPRVGSLTVTDTLARIGATLATLDALAEAGTLTAITVTDPGATLVLSAEEQANWQDALALFDGDVIIQTAEAATAPEPIRAPVINLIWDESVNLAPAGFKQAVQYAASFFDGLITSPITVNIEIGWGEARDTALAAGLLGEAYVTTGLFRSFADYGTALAAHNTSPIIQGALDNLADPGRQVFVPGAQAKALGVLAADAALTDGAIGFAANPDLYTYDPNNRAVAGKVDLIGLAQHEITHALGRVSYTWGTTGFDLYRYSAPGAWATAGSGSTYFSLDGGKTNLGTFSLTGDPADWGPAMASDVQAAFLGTGIAFTYSETDIAALNAMGYAIGTTSSEGGTSTAGDVIDPMAGSSAAHMAFEPPAEDTSPSSGDPFNDLWGSFEIPALEATEHTAGYTAQETTFHGGPWMPMSHHDHWAVSAEHP